MNQGVQTLTQFEKAAVHREKPHTHGVAGDGGRIPAPSDSRLDIKFTVSWHPRAAAPIPTVVRGWLVGLFSIRKRWAWRLAKMKIAPFSG